MSDVIQLHNLSKEEILNPIKDLQLQLEEINNNFQPKEPEEFLTRAEVAEMLKIDISSVHNWTKKGILIRYGIGHRVYYKRSEVENSLIKLK